MGAASVLQHLSASLLLACALLSGVWIRRGLSQPPGPGGIPLRIMFFTSNGGELFNSSGAVPAVDLALKDIAASPGVLGRYSLSYTTVFDSRCNRTHVLDIFYDQILSPNATQYLSVLGCGCSPASEPVAEIVHYYNLPMMSYVSSSDTLSNRVRFQSYFRTDLTEINNPPAYAALVAQYGWRRVAIVSQNENTFNSIKGTLENELTKVGVSFEEYNFMTGDTRIFQEVFTNETGNYRIFILNMYSSSARKFICESIRQDKPYEYVFIVPGWYERRWWSAFRGDIRCSDNELRAAVNQSTFGALQFPSPAMPVHPALGLNATEFDKQYEEEADSLNYDKSSSAPLAFDATWALAFAMNATAQMIEEGQYANCNDPSYEGEFVPLEEFTYSNSKMLCLLLYNLQRTNFIGVSGEVKFDGTGTRIGNTVRIEQYRANEANGRFFRRQIATYRDEGPPFVYEEGESDETVWLDGIPPDGTPQEQIRGVETGLVVVFYMLALAGLVCAGICLIFNVAFRKTKIVRLTSPNLNYLIIAGACLLYLSVFFLTYPLTDDITTLTVLCNLRFWLSSIGYTLCFSVILAKMGRVYLIFNNPTPNKKIPKDWMLLIPIGLFNVVALLMLIIPTAIPQTRFVPMKTNDTEHPPTTMENGIELQYFFYRCTANDDVLTAIVIGYLLLLQLVAVFLAFHTRKVKVKALNDSKYIAIIIYLTSLLEIISAVIYFGLEDYQNAYAALLAISIIVTASLFIGLIFVPKMILLYKDPKGENVFTSTNFPSTIDKTNALERKVKELENRLSAYKTQSTLQKEDVKSTSENGSDRKSYGVDQEVMKDYETKI